MANHFKDDSLSIKTDPLFGKHTTSWNDEPSGILSLNNRGLPHECLQNLTQDIGICVESAQMPQTDRIHVCSRPMDNSRCVTNRGKVWTFIKINYSGSYGKVL